MSTFERDQKAELLRTSEDTSDDEFDISDESFYKRFNKGEKDIVDRIKEIATRAIEGNSTITKDASLAINTLIEEGVISDFDIIKKYISRRELNPDINPTLITALLKLTDKILKKEEKLNNDDYSILNILTEREYLITIKRV